MYKRAAVIKIAQYAFINWTTVNATEVCQNLVHDKKTPQK